MRKLQKHLFGESNSLNHTIYFWICLITLSCLFTTCEKQNNSELLIEEINMTGMADKHLPDFYLLRERSIDSIRIEFVFKRESDSANIFFRTGIYSSTNQTKDIAEAYINSISLHMYEGPHQEVLIGDKYWWSENFLNNNELRNIGFIRKNVFVTMSCSHNYHELKALAINFDDDILKGDSYITFRD